MLAGAALALPGLVLRAWAAGILEKDRELSVGGPYAHTRNPLYLGSFIMGAGAATAGRNPWFGLVFVAFFTVAYGRAITRESAALERRFGSAYRHYRDAVGAFLPSARPYRPSPDHRFPAAATPRVTSFTLARYRRNREYEALIGSVAALGILALKALG